MLTFMPMIVVMDPPRHDLLRALVSRAFTPRRISDLEPRIRAIATELIDGFIESGSCDLFRDLTAQLPTIVIAELLGIPSQDRAMFKEKSTRVASSVNPGEENHGTDATTELHDYLAKAFAEKRKRPGDDLMSALLVAEIDGARLTDPELLGFAFLLLFAGNETTTNLISNGTVLLDEFPTERTRLLADPSLLPTAIEEFLRFESPIQGVERTVTETVSLHGKTLERDAKVFLMLASANRDERRIPNPEKFDVGREPNRHFSLGQGTHFCLGSSLARLETRIVFEEILKRIPDYRVSGPTKRLRASVFRGLLSIPLEFSPGPRSDARTNQ
ncbi:MAG: cytochrome P450, partial [bacterium]